MRPSMPSCDFGFSRSGSSSEPMRERDALAVDGCCRTAACRRPLQKPRSTCSELRNGDGLPRVQVTAALRRADQRLQRNCRRPSGTCGNGRYAHCPSARSARKRTAPHWQPPVIGSLIASPPAAIGRCRGRDAGGSMPWIAAAHSGDRCLRSRPSRAPKSVRRTRACRPSMPSCDYRLEAFGMVERADGQAEMAAIHIVIEERRAAGRAEAARRHARSCGTAPARRASRSSASFGASTSAREEIA